jgi:hypothetical protein
MLRQLGSLSTTSSSSSSGSSGDSNPSLQPQQQQQQQQQQQNVVSMPFNVVKVEVLTEQQVKELALYLTQDEPLPWPKPSFRPGFKTQLAMLAHARLFDTPLAGKVNSSSSKGSRSSSSGSSGSRNGSSSVLGLLPEGAVATQRPKLEGQYAEKVGGGLGSGPRGLVGFSVSHGVLSCLGVILLHSLGPVYIHETGVQAVVVLKLLHGIEYGSIYGHLPCRADGLGKGVFCKGVHT